MKSRLALMTLMIAMLAAMTATAQSVPDKINYQGKLNDSGGQPVNDASMPMEFSLWDKDVTAENVMNEQVLMGGTAAHALAHQDLTPGSEVVTGQGGAPVYQTPRDYTMDYVSGTITRVDAFAGGFIPDGATVEVDYAWTSYGSTLWSEGQVVEVVNGLYQVRLGAVNPITAPVLAGGSAFLEVVVNGSTLSPRQELTSVPFALRAAEADDSDLLDGLDSADFALASHTHDFSELMGTVSDAQVPDNITVVLSENSSQLNGLPSDAFVLVAGDTMTGHLQVNGPLSTGQDLSVTGDATIMGGNIGIGTSPSSMRGISNDSATAPFFGAYLYGANTGLLGALASDPADHYGYFGSVSYGAYAQCGNSDETAARYGGSFVASTQGLAYGVYGAGFGSSVNDAIGVYGLGQNTGTGASQGIYAFGYKDSGAGISQGVYGYGYNDGSGNAYGGYFGASGSGVGTHFGVFATADDYSGWFQGGRVHVGNAGTEDYVDGDGDLYVEDELEVDGTAHFSGGIDAPGAIDAADVNFNYAGSASKGGSANDSNLLNGQNETFYRDASNITAGTLDPSFFSAYSDLSAEGYLDNNAAGDLITQSQGDGRYVNQWETWASNLSVTGDVTVSGGNIGLATAPSPDSSIINDPASAPLYGAYLSGAVNGIFSSWAGDPGNHYVSLGAENFAVYANAGSSYDTNPREAGIFVARSQSTTYGVDGEAFGSSVSVATGVYGYGSNSASGPARGVFGYGYKNAGTGGDAQGVYGYALNSTPGDAYGGYFYAATVGTGQHYALFADSYDYAAWLQNGRVHIGSSGSEDHVNGNGDLYVQNVLEADGNAFVGGDVTVSGGNIGLGISPSSSYGISNNAASAPYAGVNLYGTNYGMYTYLASDPADHYAYLVSQATGIYSKTGNSDETASRYAISSMASSQGLTYGVYTQSYGYGTSNTYGVYGYASNGSGGNAFGVYAWGTASGGGTGYGIYSAVGSKNWVNPDPEDPDHAVAYVTVESGENVTYYSSSARLVNGRAEITLPDHFRKVTSPDYRVTVQLTPRSLDSLGLAVVESDNAHLVVGELMHGSGNYEFDYTVKGMRLGYEDYEPIIANQDYVPFQGNHQGMDESETTTQQWYDSMPKGLKRIFEQNGTLDKNGKVNEAMFKQKGWKDVKEKKEKPQDQGLK